MTTEYYCEACSVSLSEPYCKHCNSDSKVITIHYGTDCLAVSADKKSANMQAQ